ncbi:MAG: MFS transporter [Deltaproteobacteria bacterium CG11_big_fil_rev_8_21_14_0_20_45_16]|nr:MAG: MFS transporter [Deltaproteobacteria bacterium CG11_big_fil_rev_8_21_14_0_20_45_16]
MIQSLSKKSYSKRQIQSSWIFVDVGNSAFATTVLAAVFPQYLPSLLPPQGITIDLGFLSWKTSAISIWGYAVSLSIGLTLVLSLLIGQWADYRGYRKRMLGIFTAFGAMATILLGFTGDWLWALGFFVIANIGFSGSNVFYNALLAEVAPDSEWDNLSLKAVAWGYISGGLILALNLIMIMKHDWFGLSSAASGTRASFVVVGIWWMLWTFPSLVRIKESANLRSKVRLGLSSLKSIWISLRSMVYYPMALIFLISFALYNDGISTTISMAAIIGKEALQLGSETVIGTLLLIQFLGWPLTGLMIGITKWTGAKKLLSLSLMIWLGIIFYASMMETALDFWVLGAAVAVVLGVSQALSRSIFTRLIPEGRQSEYFSLYALSGKFCSILGPLVFGLVRDMTGDVRWSILSLAAFFALGLILLQFVSIDPTRPRSVDLKM